jgi:hypothetical protein
MSTLTIVTEQGLYLYGITLAGGAPALPPGVGGRDVELVLDGALAAVVTRMPTGRIRPQRSNLAAHHQVLRDLADRQSVLPVAFGTIAENETRVREIMRRNRGALIAQLRRLQGAVEMALKVYWETGNIFEFFVAGDQELEQMRNRLFGPGRLPTMDEKLELGRRFESAVEESRRRHTKRVTEALAPSCLDIRALDCSDERMVMKLACLVEKNRRQEWETGVEAAARLFDNHYCFQYGGPWAPFNFAEVTLE